jgi:nitroreductase
LARLSGGCKAVYSRRETPQEGGDRSKPGAKMNETLDLLARRRSLKPAALAAPGPDAEATLALLTLAARVPDHGKLAPWRFIVIEGEGRERLGRIALELRLADKPDLDDSGREAELTRFSRAPLVVAVVSRAAPHAKIPEWEQVLSAGAACMNLIVAAKAMGFAAAWLTEWCAYDSRFRERLGLAPHEKIAGFVYLGRATFEPEDRVRPVMEEIVSRFA